MKGSLWSVTVLFLVFFGRSDAAVYIKTSNYTLEPVADLPADFGPGVSDGIEGQVVIADPEDGCQELAVPPIEDSWIALITRSQKGSPSTCSFDMKVRNAEAAGASAVLVYDNLYEPLLIMAKPPGAADPGIPAFFISAKSGMLIHKLVQAGITFALIVPVAQGLWMSVLVSSLAGLICVTFVVVTFLFVSHRQRLRNSPDQLGYRLMADEAMTPAQLRTLPVVVYDKPVNAQLVRDRWEGRADGDKSDSDSSGSNAGVKGGGTRKTCAVCIEDYRDGDKLRVLPCQHRFHMECIDQWLSTRKPLCPICKWDAKQEFVASAALEADIEDPSPSQRSPIRRTRWPWRRWGRSGELDDAQPVLRPPETPAPSRWLLAGRWNPFTAVQSRSGPSQRALSDAGAVEEQGSPP